MKVKNHTEETAVEKPVSTIDFDNFDWEAEEDALNDEAFERMLRLDARAGALRDIDRLKADVRRGVKSVRGAVIDDDSLSGLAQEAYTRTGNRMRQAFSLGREWALENLPTLAELRRQDRRYERRDRREARRAKHRGENIFVSA